MSTQMTDRLDALALDLDNLRDVFARQYAVPLRDQGVVIGGMAAKIEALTAEITSHRINTAACIGQNDERMDNLEKHCEALQAKIEDRLKLNAALDVLERKNIDRMNAEPAPMSSYKRATIKGGWVNVYLRDFGRQAFISQIHKSKSEADRTYGDDPGESRIACIHIPDITEGEGL